MIVGSLSNWVDLKFGLIDSEKQVSTNSGSCLIHSAIKIVPSRFRSCANLGPSRPEPDEIILTSSSSSCWRRCKAKICLSLRSSSFFANWPELKPSRTLYLRTAFIKSISLLRSFPFPYYSFLCALVCWLKLFFGFLVFWSCLILVLLDLLRFLSKYKFFFLA